MLIGLGGLWLTWLAGWLNRVELTRRAQPSASALGLTFEAEGPWARVVASGNVQGVAVRVRWRVGWSGRHVEVAWRGGRWSEVPEDAELVAWMALNQG